MSSSETIADAISRRATSSFRFPVSSSNAPDDISIEVLSRSLNVGAAFASKLSPPSFLSVISASKASVLSTTFLTILRDKSCHLRFSVNLRILEESMVFASIWVFNLF